jgi:glycine betaine/choline ABC-type transport system substrate-binding protein
MKRRKMLALAMLGSAVLAGCGSSSTSSTGGGRATVCIQSEFRTRADGVPGLAATYGVDSNYAGFKDIGGNTAEKQIASGECNAGEVFTTDSAIGANNLYVLQDDKKLFPPDNVGLLIRSSVQKAHPEIGAIMAPLAQKLTTDVMIGLNKEVEIDGKKFEDVAKDFLAKTDVSGGTSPGGATSACPVSGSAASTGSGSLKLGSKGFAEEQLLASMTKQLLEKHGFTVDYSFTAKDPALGQALESGAIDMYWQYTGTELQGPLAVDKPPTDLQAAFDLAKSKDDARGICWNAQAAFNDTNGIAIKTSDKGKYGSTLSEFAQYLKNNP